MCRNQNKETKTNINKPKTCFDDVTQRRGSFDHEVLDGDRDEDGGHGQEGDDEERKLFVRQAAFWLLGLGCFGPRGARGPGGVDARWEQDDGGAVGPDDFRGVLALPDGADTKSVVRGQAQVRELEGSG